MCYGFENREMESFLPDTDAVNQRYPHASPGFLQYRNNLLHTKPFRLHAKLLPSKVSFAEN